MTTIKYFLFVAILLGGISAVAQIDSNFKLPEKWTKDFTITLSYRGSMGGGYTDVKFTYDSCIYKNGSNTEKPTSRVKLLNESDRTAILQKLRAMKADEIKAESSVNVVHDGWSQSICFNFNCIEGGTSAQMSEADKNQFLEAYRYLEEFASKKGSKR